MRYLIVAFIIIMLSACENTRHSMGVTAKPFAKGDKMEDSIKLNYKIVFGKVRNKNEEDED
mgnify:CR=1 FL=1